MPKLVRGLLDPLPENERQSALGDLLIALAGIYRSRRVAPPSWLEDVEGEYPEHMAFIDYVIATETIRFALRGAARENRKGLSGVAKETGVPLKSLKRIVGSVDFVSASTWEPLTEFSRARGALAPHPSVIGLALAVADLRREHRTGARELLTRTLADYLRERGTHLPDWLQDELAPTGVSVLPIGASVASPSPNDSNE